MGRSEAERMRAATFVVVVLAAAVVHGINPPASPQDEILAESITSNFACKVDSVEVNMDVAGSEEKTTVTADDLKTALARTATLEGRMSTNSFLRPPTAATMRRTFSPVVVTWESS